VKRFLTFITLLAVFAGSCSFLDFGQSPAEAVDTQATIDAMVRKSAEETAAAQPSPTTVLSTPTSTPVLAVASPTLEATVTATATGSAPTAAPSSTPAPDLTTTPVTPAPNLTTTPVTATSGPGDYPTATKAASGNLTLTPTAGVLLYGTLPPAVPSAKITIINRSRVQAYISLQNYPPGREAAFLEYPVINRVKVDAPLGYYVYVVWVGGRKVVGEFSLHKDDDLTITIYKDKVEISN
jgi:hypothetical protein